eukprot:TRINITY_DN21628_c0_g1_i1.p1 TRINITY_DN21628_c0_g1~~TRINITY_DN21628_c0_g1_i1.p1  ORF type:complete len:190 (+),score=18.71 TRINITY_DN21628_c0_g1_i1:427-996(+)
MHTELVDVVVLVPSRRPGSRPYPRGNYKALSLTGVPRGKLNKAIPAGWILRAVLGWSWGHGGPRRYAPRRAVSLGKVLEKQVRDLSAEIERRRALEDRTAADREGDRVFLRARRGLEYQGAMLNRHADLFQPGRHPRSETGSSAGFLLHPTVQLSCGGGADLDTHSVLESLDGVYDDCLLYTSPSPRDS